MYDLIFSMEMIQCQEDTFEYECQYGYRQPGNRIPVKESW